MSSPKPGLPPLVVVDQNDAQDFCNTHLVGGQPKRLPTRREHVIAAAWDSDDQLTTLLPDGTTASIDTV
jgi:formylglycine-generating enzyme required for sulfatase activity